MVVELRYLKPLEDYIPKLHQLLPFDHLITSSRRIMRFLIKWLLRTSKQPKNNTENLYSWRNRLDSMVFKYMEHMVTWLIRSWDLGAIKEKTNMEAPLKIDADLPWNLSTLVSKFSSRGKSASRFLLARVITTNMMTIQLKLILLWPASSTKEKSDFLKFDSQHKLHLQDNNFLCFLRNKFQTFAKF